MQDTGMLYDFVPMPERKPLKWPNGKRLALMVTLNLEYWELTQDHDGPYFPGGPSINERLLPARIPDFNNHSWREYGHRVGIWRLYDIFDEAKVPASCTVNGILCERHPQIVTGGGQARLGADRAQPHPDRIHDQLPRRPRQGARGHQARARRDREDHGPAAEGLAVVVAPLHGEHLRHLQGARADLSLRLHERRAALSDQHRARAAGVDPLHAGGQRHRHVPAPQSHRDRSLRACGRTSSTSSTARARQAAAS